MSKPPIPLSIRSMCLVVATAFAAVAGLSAHADETNDAAQACAEASHQQTDATRYELIRVIERSGVGNFEMWLNAEDRAVRAYCLTRSGSVDRLEVQQGEWRSTNLIRPRQEAATSADA